MIYIFHLLDLEHDTFNTYGIDWELRLVSRRINQGISRYFSELAMYWQRRLDWYAQIFTLQVITSD